VESNRLNNFAVSTDGLATALQDSASALMSANNSYEEAAAMVAAANKVVQDPSKVGGGLRTIALRLRGTKVEGEEDNDSVITSKSKLQGKIKGLTGVDILTDTGAYKSTYEILLEISRVWKDMNDMDQAECCLYVQKCA
jgi:TP901 family phage tail tape measure protein